MSANTHFAKSSDEYPRSRPAIEKAARERQAEYHGKHYDKSRLPLTFGEASKADAQNIQCLP